MKKNIFGLMGLMLTFSLTLTLKPVTFGPTEERRITPTGKVSGIRRLPHFRSPSIMKETPPKVKEKAPEQPKPERKLERKKAQRSFKITKN